MGSLAAAAGVVEGVAGGIYLLIGAGALALLGVLLTVRESRQRRFDERSDQRSIKLEARNETLEADNDKLREEQARLRFLLRSRGIDPDTPVTTP